MSDEQPRHRGNVPRTRKIAGRVLVGIGVAVLLVATSLVVAYKHFEGNITAIDINGKLGDRPSAVKASGPKQPLNVLVMGSDTREGANGKGIGGSTPGLSDTTILLHLSADRKHAFGVSLPRDAMVKRPSCEKKNGSGIDHGGLTQFNAAYAVGGPACTVKTVEQLTKIRVDHFVVIDFVGFKKMVDAINGVTVCVPTKVDDSIGHIQLPAGTYKVDGQQALDYVRVRHDLGAETGDIGRMKRQQTFIAAMIKKVVSAGTLANPVRLYKFLDAATSSLSTDKAFSSLKQLASLGSSLKNIGLDNVKFITVPFEEYPPDPNRVEWAPQAERLWRQIRYDKPLGSQLDEDVVSASGDPTNATGGASPSGSPSGSPTGTSRRSAQEKADAAKSNGLCT